MPQPFTPAPRQGDETIPEYAARVLRILLDTYTCAPFTLEDLELADRAAQCAVSSLPTTLDPADQIINRKLGGVRTMIAGELAWRRRMAQAKQDAAQAVAKALYPTPGGHGGRPAPLTPPRPTLPPGGAYAPLVQAPPRQSGDGIQF